MRLLLTAIVFATLTAGCSRSGVEVQNAANVTITNIEIRVAGNEIGIDRIDPGGSQRVTYSTKTEDTLAISFQMQGAEKQCSSGIYVSPPMEDDFMIRISSDGKCSISNDYGHPDLSL